MKPLTYPGTFALLSLIALFLAGCASTTSTTANPGNPKERLLAQAGFKLRDVTTPKQRERLSSLPADRVSPVRYHGRTYYVYPMTASNQAYIGRKAQYRNYIEMLKAEKAKMAQSGPNAPVFTEEVAGASPITIREYDEWGPMFPETE